ncbi:MAG TPA: HAD family phosphatase [Acidimicrobiia bacterium]|nr:HAD family phosphatase [Acidimicrobiia bacterium]
MKAVLFDYGGVLTEPMGPMFAAVAADCGAEVADLVALLVGGYGDGDHPWHRLERGELPFDALCRWAADEGGRRGWRLDLRRMLDHLHVVGFRPALLERITDLRRRGYRTALVTNNAREFGPYWKDRLPYDDLFDTVVDSCEVGVRKPDPRIYQLTLERLGGLAPDEAVLLDDFEVNLEAARAIGMHGVAVGDDTDAALAELERLLDDGALADRGRVTSSSPYPGSPSHSRATIVSRTGHAPAGSFGPSRSAPKANSQGISADQ